MYGKIYAKRTMQLVKDIESNLLLYLLYYAGACNELAAIISASLCPGNTAPFEENVAAVVSCLQHYV